MPSRCDIPVVLDQETGGVRIWRMTLRAMDELENALKQLRGKDVAFSEFRSEIQRWKASEWALYLWAGLHATDPALTYEQVRDIANTEVLDQFTVDVMEMLRDTAPRQLKKRVEEAVEAERLKSSEPLTSSPLPSGAAVQ
jgi:hypothetical protein